MSILNSGSVPPPAPGPYTNPAVQAAAQAMAAGAAGAPPFATGAASGTGRVSPIQNELDAWRDYWARAREVATNPPVPDLRISESQSGAIQNVQDTARGQLVDWGTEGLPADIRGRQALGEVERWVSESQAKFTEEQQRLHGLVSRITGKSDLTPEDLVKEWAWAIDQMDVAEHLGMDYATPWHWLEQRADSIDEDKDGLRDAVTTVQRTVNITDPETAQTLAKRLISAAVGRRATDEELSMFADALRGHEEENPSVVTTAQQYDEEGRVTESESTTEGGSDPQAFADNWLDEMFSEEMDIERVGTEYFNVAQQLVGGIAD